MGSVSAQTLTAGASATIDLTSAFTDPDSDALTYGATSSNTAVATVSVSGSVLTISAVAAGQTTVTITATDPGGLSASLDAAVAVTPANRAPAAVGSVSAQTLTAGASATIDLTSAFTDPDSDALTYGATSSNTAVATVSVSGSVLMISAVAAGQTTVAITATDPGGLSASLDAVVTVTPANRAPAAVGSVSAQTLTAGASATIDLTSAFTDPDSDALTYGATSSNTAVATVSVSGSVLTISAVAAGQTTVAITATDPGGLSASLDAVVTVTPANRAPAAVGSVSAQTLTAGASATIDLTSAFTDPDSDALTYGATSSNTAVATVSVSGSVLTISAVAAGNATVTATATDPGGLSASHAIAVTVVDAGGGGGVSGTVLRDDFNSSASLSIWELANAQASVSAGVLRLTSTSAERVGRARRSLGLTITEWEIGVRMGTAQTGEGHGAAVVLRTGHSRYSAISFDVGSFSYGNFGLWFFDQNESRWVSDSEAGLVGTSGAINTGSGEFTDIVIEFKNSELRAVAAGVTLFEANVGTAIPTAIMEVELWVLDPEGESGNTALFDRIAIDGQRSGGGGSTPGISYETGETITTLPTGFWFPDASGGGLSFEFSAGQVTLEFRHNAWLVAAGIRYTCIATGGCRIDDRVVTQGTIRATGTSVTPSVNRKRVPDG